MWKVKVEVGSGKLHDMEVGEREVWWCSNWKWKWNRAQNEIWEREHGLKWKWEWEIEKKLRSEIGAGLVLETEAETGQMP
jgi:hypothetical protein